MELEHRTHRAPDGTMRHIGCEGIVVESSRTDAGAPGWLKSARLERVRGRCGKCEREVDWIEIVPV